MTAIERVINRAKGEIGYVEKGANAALDDKTANQGSGNWNKYARDLDALGIYNGRKNGYEWCDIFTDWCFIAEFGKEIGMKMLCQPERSYGAGVNSSARYYRQLGRLDKTPRVGDQIFFVGSDKLYYHTGIVISVDDEYITTVEGNTADSVAQRVYSRGDARIGAFGHPRWDLAEEADEEAAAPQPAPLKVGDRVRLAADAVVYGTALRFSKWVYDRVLFVRAIDGDRVAVSTLSEGSLTGRVHAKQLVRLEEGEAEEDEGVVRTGDAVRLKDGAKVYGRDYGFSSWVYDRTLYVRSISGDRAAVSISRSGAVTGSVDINDIEKAG